MRMLNLEIHPKMFIVVQYTKDGIGKINKTTFPIRIVTKNEQVNNYFDNKKY